MIRGAGIKLPYASIAGNLSLGREQKKTSNIRGNKCLTHFRLLSAQSFRALRGIVAVLP